MTGRYWLDKDGNPEPVDDLIKWALWYEKADRSVSRTEVGAYKVSTVFLALDHSFGGGRPVLYETMIFGGDSENESWQYSTWDEAVEGHNAVVEQLRSGKEPSKVEI